MVARAKKYTDDVEFSPMDASRADPAYIYQILEVVINAGATTVNIPDTVGYATPQEFGGLIQGAKNMMAVALACASAGIIVGVVNMGLGWMISAVVENLARGNIVLLLLITATSFTISIPWIVSVKSNWFLFETANKINKYKMEKY